MSDKYFKAGVRVMDMGGSNDAAGNTELTRLGQKVGPEIGRLGSAIAKALYDSNAAEAKRNIATLMATLREIDSKL